MRNIDALLMAALAAGAANVAAQAPQQSRIEQVLVYPGGATVERSVALKAGQQQLKLVCLPAALDPSSLQLRADGVGIGEVSIETVDRAAMPECANGPLDARIRELEEQRAALANEAAAHDLALGYLRNAGDRNGAGAQVAAAAETLRRAGLDHLQRQQQFKRKADELERRLAPLVAERDKLVKQHPDVRTLLVRLAAPRDVELRLSYRLPRAGWEPVYRAHLDTDTGKVRLERHAQVAQTSGEDWRDVKLRLSTVQPRQATALNPPAPWLLDLLPPVPADARAPAPKQALLEKIEVTGSRIREDQALGFDYAVFQGEFATEFESPGRTTVASDGEKIALTLGQVQLDGRLVARVQPRQDAQAYLVAETARPAGVWPAGQLQLFRDGAFVGQGRLSLGGDPRLDLFFGRDPLVAVRLDPEQRQAANAGFIGARAEQKLARVYRVENQHRRALTVQLLESAPVAQHEDIRVEARFDPKPAEESWRKQPGVIAWEAVLAPGAAQRFGADYVISYPRDARIGGLR